MTNIKSLLVFLSICCVLVIAIYMNANGDSNKNTMECTKSGIIGDIRNVVDIEISNLLDQPANDLTQSISDDVIDNLKNLEECTIQLVAARISANEKADEKGCDMFKILITLGGLRSKLQETKSCATSACNDKELAISKDVMLLQSERLKKLLKLCEK